MERRNLYRVLQVQPDAPAEVITASFRALMRTLGAHPDLGGDHEQATRLTAAYAVLSDPAQREQYDREHPPAWADGAPGGTPCPFCGERYEEVTHSGQRCAACEAPLWPAPTGFERNEQGGRRRSVRVEVREHALLRRPGGTRELGVQVRDRSPNGISAWSPVPVDPGTVVRIVSATLDALVEVVACRRAGAEHVLHGRLLTLQPLRPYLAR